MGAYGNYYLYCHPSMHSGGDALRLPGGYQVANGLNRFAVNSWSRSAMARWLAGPLFPERQSGQGQGGQLAAGNQGAIQFDHASLRAALRGTHWQITLMKVHMGIA